MSLRFPFYSLSRSIRTLELGQEDSYDILEITAKDGCH